MTRVDFYRLAKGGDEAVLHSVCLLAGKALQSGYRVRIYAAEPERLEDLDVRLWTFRQGSFLPHARETAADPDFPEPILLSDRCGGEPGEGEVLVCASPPPPECVAGHVRVAEFVPPDSGPREAARRRYAAYRDAGYELHAHDLTLN